MDAFAVTISNSCAYPDTTRTQRFAMPVIFGIFQGLMPFIGYFAGTLASSFIETYAGFIALLILGVIGGRMVWGGAKALLETDRSEAGKANPTPTPETAAASPAAPKQRGLSAPMLLLQAIATSIDALIVGVSLLALGANIFIAAPLVAFITFVCCLVALILGRRFGVLLGDKAEIVGGVILILIGIKALF